MIISMQGNWNVRVKSKSAAFSQRVVITGATSGNGEYPGVVGTDVDVIGNQWSIAIQNDPGSGYQLSDTQIKFPRVIGDYYEFEIWSNDAGGDEDFNDLILACRIPININDFLIYGTAKRYSGRCFISPCWNGPYVIETLEALAVALKNPKLRDYLLQHYPERVREDIIRPPIPDPDPAPFKPIVIDLFGEATQPKTELYYQRTQLPAVETKSKSRAKEVVASDFAASNFTLINSKYVEAPQSSILSSERIELAKVIDGLRFPRCLVSVLPNTTLTFEEYDRTAAEMAGGPYTGDGPRRLLGDAITDMNGNYIFRFSFDMMLPYLEDAADVAPGEDPNVVLYPDVIVKLTEMSPYRVLYESAPYYNIPNLKRIDLCIPASVFEPSSACFNGNLIGSLGNVFIGGNQNVTASYAAAALQRYGDNNSLEETGIVTVKSSLAGFNIDCAPWYGTVDFKGCMYDLEKPATENNVRWYTIRIRRAGTSNWQFVSENYKHPKFHNRHLPNYNGDDVGPFPVTLKIDGGAPVNDVPAYINIQREIFVDGVDWEFSNLDRYMQLHTRLYDVIAGERVPGTFYVRVDCYDDSGNLVPGGTDMIALFIHNKLLNFGLTAPDFTDPAIVNSGCGLHRLDDTQMNTPIQLSFEANDPEGFVHFYDLSMRRCPSPMIGLTINQPISGSTPAGPTPQPHPTTPNGRTTLFNGISASVQHACTGYRGTIDDFGSSGLITVEIEPDSAAGGWIKPGEYFTSLTFHLRAYKRMTNGYNTGLSIEYYAPTQILMERLNP